MKKLPVLAIILILIFCFFHVRKNRWTSDYNAWTVIVVGDGYGYCAYLPAIFLQHNLDFEKALNAVRKIRPGLPDEYLTSYILHPDDKHQLNKCFVGIAILLIPFFLLGCIWAKLAGYDVDGFSYPFQLSISIAGLFYLLVGLIFIYKLLKLYGVRDLVICFTLFAVVFATNLFYYAAMEPSMPHIYGFALVSLFLYFSKKSMEDYRLKNLIWVVLSLGILVIIRPTNVLIVLAIPFLAGSLKNTGTFIGKVFKSKQTMIAAGILLAVVSLQFIMWHAETGHWFVWSYPGEGFNFSKPHFIDILFSYRKGWFVYTPLMFFTLLISSFVFIRKNKFQFLSLMIFFVVVTYVLSSWWYWAYGGSFGSRPFVDFYPVFAMALALSVNTFTSLWVKIPGIIIAVLCTWLNYVQTWQYDNFILPKDGIDKATYWKLFLKKSVPEETTPVTVDIEKDFNFLEKYTVSNDFEHNTWGTDINLTAAYAHSGTYSVFSNTTLPFTPVYADTVSNLPKVQNGKLSIFIKLWMYEPDTNNDAKLVVSVEEKGKSPYFYVGDLLKAHIDSCNRWRQIENSFELPATYKNSNDILKTYIYTTESIVYIDDEEIKFGVRK